MDIRSERRAAWIRAISLLLATLAVTIFVLVMLGGRDDAGELDRDRLLGSSWGISGRHIRRAEGKPSGTWYRLLENGYRYERARYGYPSKTVYRMNAFFKLHYVGVEIEPGALPYAQAQELLQRVRGDLERDMRDPRRVFVRDDHDPTKTTAGIRQTVRQWRDFWADDKTLVWTLCSWNEVTHRTHVTVHAYDAAHAARSGEDGYVLRELRKFEEAARE